MLASAHIEQLDLQILCTMPAAFCYTIRGVWHALLRWQMQPLGTVVGAREITEFLATGGLLG